MIVWTNASVSFTLEHVFVSRRLRSTGRTAQNRKSEQQAKTNVYHLFRSVRSARMLVRRRPPPRRVPRSRRGGSRNLHRFPLLRLHHWRHRHRRALPPRTCKLRRLHLPWCRRRRLARLPAIWLERVEVLTAAVRAHPMGNGMDRLGRMGGVVEMTTRAQTPRIKSIDVVSPLLRGLPNRFPNIKRLRLCAVARFTNRLIRSDVG